MESPREPAGGMTFFGHLEELRRRLFWAAIALVIGFLVCYPLSDRIFDFLQEPIRPLLQPGEALAFTRLTEPFFIYMKVAALAGLMVASPFVLLQLWLFVSPALYRNEKRYAVPFVLSATAFFLLGAAFAYRFLFPSICRFFLGQARGFRMVVTLDEYFSLLFWTVIGVAATFELPVLIGLLAKMGVVRARFLLRHSDAAAVVCLVLSAIITPTPDAMTMLFVAVPMVGLYFVGVLVAKLLEPAELTLASPSVPPVE